MHTLTKSFDPNLSISGIRQGFSSNIDWKNNNQEKNEAVNYYNIQIVNKNSSIKERILAEYIDRRVAPVLQKPSEWQVGVVRFYIPNTGIPLMIIEDDYYFVTLQYEDAFVTKPVNWIPITTNPATQGFYYNYVDFINSLNLAFQQSFDDLKALKPAIAVSVAPYFNFEATTKLIYFYAENTFYLSTLANPIKIYLSFEFVQIMGTFLNTGIDNLPSPRDIRLLVKDNKDNKSSFGGLNYYYMYQERETLSAFNILQTIVLKSDTLPISNEFSPGLQFNNFNTSGLDVTQRIMTDFEPIQENPTASPYQYFPSGPIRFYDLKSDYPLHTIDLRVFWKSKTGIEYPIYLYNNETITVKLMFRKKSKYLFSDNFENE